MKEENNNSSRVEKYSDLRKEITEENGSKAKKVQKEKKLTYKKTKKESVLSEKSRIRRSTETITVPINVNSAIETKNIELEPVDEGKTPEIFKAYKKKRIWKIVLYFLLISVVLTGIIFILVFLFRK